MYSEEHEFTAVHEAGHVVCVACFPPPQSVVGPLRLPEDIPSSRTKEIILVYDEVAKRFDGHTDSDLRDLSKDQRLFTELGGKVVEIMARTEGNWDITAIQTEILSEFLREPREGFAEPQDVRNVRGLLNDMNENDWEARLKTEVSRLFSFLRKNWELVIQVADSLLSTYNPASRQATVYYEKLSDETKTQLNELQKASSA